MSLPVSEIFASFQGEGPRSGRPCTFIRFGGCNLSCSWCDSAYTWDTTRYNLREELTQRSAEDIFNDLDPDCQEVILTGGEPLMHQGNEDWATLLRLLVARNIYIAVETNGTIVPNEVTQTHVQHYSISPKLENAGKHKRNQDPRMAAWPDRIVHNKSCLKFVVTNVADVQRAAEVADRSGWPRWNTWVQPEGITTEAIVKNFGDIAQEAIRQGINVGTRLHVLAFGNKRGT